MPFWGWTMHPLRWCSPGGAQTSPNSCITCVSVVMCWIATSLSPPLRCQRPCSVEDFLITPGGRPRRRSGLSHCPVCWFTAFVTSRITSQTPCAPWRSTSARPAEPRVTPIMFACDTRTDPGLSCVQNVLEGTEFAVQDLLALRQGGGITTNDIDGDDERPPCTQTHQRTEQQLLLCPQSAKGAGVAVDASARADRSGRTAAVGACRKATTSLVASMLSFDVDEDHWRAPKNFHRHSRWRPRCTPIRPPAPLDTSWDWPIAALHHAALTAPGLAPVRSSAGNARTTANYDSSMCFLRS